MNRVFGTSFSPADAWSILRRFERLSHHNKTIYSRDNVFCSRAISRSGCCRGGLSKAFYYDCVRTFYGVQLMTCCTYHRLVLSVTDNAAYALIAWYPRILFQIGYCTRPLTILKWVSVVLRFVSSLACRTLQTTLIRLLTGTHSPLEPDLFGGESLSSPNVDILSTGLFGVTAVLCCLSSIYVSALNLKISR